MAENITSLELNGIKYALGKSIYAELDLSLERFVELLGRDFYCPTLNSAPTSTTKTYQDTDESVNTFQIGQPCRWKESDGTYRLAVLADMTGSSATWYKLPVKVSELTNDAGYLTSHQDISHLATKTELNKKQDIISDLSEIRDGASKGSTALQSVPSGYVTETELSEKGYATTSALSSGLSGKVDKDGDKVLSTNDFTNALKSKLEGLINYDDTTVNNAIIGLQTQLDTLVSGNANAAIESFNEIIAFLDGVSDTETLDGIIASIEQQIAGKQAIISDLETIRIGASKGVTAVQPSSLHAVATSGSYNDLIDKPELPDSNTPLSIECGGTGANNKEDACTNLGAAKQYYMQKNLSKEGWYRIGLLSAVMSTSSARIVVGGTNADVAPIIMDFQHNFRGNMLSQMPTVMTPLYVTKVRACRYTSDDMYIDVYFTNVSGSMTTVSVFPLEGTFEPMNFMDVTEESVSVATSIDVLKDGFLTGRLTSEDVSDVAISGSYNDLSDKPTIPNEVTESTVSGWGFTKNAGTITGIKMNGASKGTSGVVDLGTVITSHQDISGKLDSSTAASTYLSKTDAASTYLGKTAKAASATTADSATKATQDASGNVITSTYATKSSVNAKQDAALKFENMSASTWVSDSTYEDFPYRCDIACSGVTSSMYAEVVFGVDEAISGDYAPMCETKSNIVSIWSAKDETITVPTILITK